jgi:hypothetical protein
VREGNGQKKNSIMRPNDGLSNDKWCYVRFAHDCCRSLSRVICNQRFRSDVNDVLVAHHIPDAVTCQNEEQVVWLNWQGHNA